MTERDYVLGTHDDEIERLGLQHRVWRDHVLAAWRRAGFAAGQTLLDVGCGPGWATLDLAAIVGPAGRVVGIDRSRRFLDHAAAAARAAGRANVELLELDLDERALPELGADGAWSRWVYAFVSKPRELLANVVRALRPGGTIVIHEYADYRTWRPVPERPAFEAFVGEVMASWRAGGGEPDIGRVLPVWLHELGCDVRTPRPLLEIARPGDAFTAWPTAFVEVGVQRLVDLGRIDAATGDAIRAAYHESQATPGAFQVMPLVVEIVATRR
jgi:SAM-dependent methyltransferase